MYRDLTKGPIGPGLVRFALPMMLGTLLQQTYNLADTLIAGRALGRCFPSISASGSRRSCKAPWGMGWSWSWV